MIIAKNYLKTFYTNFLTCFVIEKSEHESISWISLFMEKINDYKMSIFQGNDILFISVIYLYTFLP